MTLDDRRARDAWAGTPAGRRPSRRSRRTASGRPGSWPSIARPRSCATAPATGRPACPARSGTPRWPTPTSRPWATGSPCEAGDVIAAVLPRRQRVQADGHGREPARDAASTTSRSWPRTSTSPCSSPGLDNDFNLRRIERYLAVAWSSAIEPGRRPEQVRPGRRRGWPPRRGRRDRARRARSSRCRRGPATGSTTLRAHLRPGTTAAILGSSGVGKSTLVNALLGEDRQATGEVRGDDSRGRHTTTHRELFELPGGALLVDTPGIRSLEVARRRRRRGRRLRRRRRPRARPAGSATAGTRASPAARSGPRSTTAASPRSVWRAIASSSASSREPPARRDPRARAEHRRTWKIIHKSVDEHMATEVRSRAMTSIETTSRNAVASRTRLPDPAAAPAIPGLSVRAFRDRTDYAHLARPGGHREPGRRDPVPADRRLARDRHGELGRREVHGRHRAGRGGRAAGRRGRGQARRPRDPPVRGLGHGRPEPAPPRPRDVADGLDHRPCPRARRTRGPGRARRAGRVRRGFVGRSHALCSPGRASSRSATSS